MNLKFYLTIIFILAFLTEKTLSQEMINKICTTASGKSIYKIEITSELESIGNIVLLFNNEDNLYSAKVKIITTDTIVGVARFKGSKTGQTEAKPWVFTYKISTNTLIDDGRLEAVCN